ncbi:hypothetical protein DPX16_3596 [Anabarilius grahami]|uniref:Uncharacterized protein n=1 Tax=Anabarilius grahami TaxID=495550 RepID=A0A3N0XRW3_ANAGA|nr:hypothetical protein DPX16_3596 [Anabarilius grahami]
METTTPEPPADGELPPAARMEPATTAPTRAPEPKFPCESDQGCELATAVPVGILVEIDTGEDWLIDWNTEVLLPTLPHPNLPLSPLPSSTAISPALPQLSSCSPSSSPVSTDSKVHGRTGSASGFGNSDVASGVRHRASAKVSSSSGVTRSHQLSVIAWGSPDIGSVSIGHPTEVVDHVYSLAPPSFDTAVGCHHHRALGRFHLAAPPVTAPMDAPSIYFSMESLPLGLPVSASPLPAPSPQPFSSSSPSSKVSTIIFTPDFCFPPPPPGRPSTSRNPSSPPF